VKEPPKDIEPADVSAPKVEDPEILEIGLAKYEEAGSCAVCAKKVYRWIDNGHQAHDAIGDALVVYAAFSHREPPGIYCKEHDPNIQHRLNSPILTPDRQQVRMGDTWRPRV